MSRIRRPELGDRVIYEYDEEQIPGTVDNLLSAQFALVTDDGRRLLVLYKELWDYEDRKPTGT